MIAINIAVVFIVTGVAISAVIRKYRYQILRNDVSHSVIKISYNANNMAFRLFRKKTAL